MNILKYDWKEIQKYYDDNHSLRDCKKKFGFHWESYNLALKRGDIKTRNKSESLKCRYKK
jgi:hypothetical protein